MLEFISIGIDSMYKQLEYTIEDVMQYPME
jgi:hypothetical protein